MPDGVMRDGTVTAVLGPTNTGKTHLAMDRLAAHSSGMIGFPLRLLARENYDRAVARLGVRNVALITGEEKIIPTGARYFLCTVESMPVDRPVAFLAIDEIQLCADPDRGHLFTDRLLSARGSQETMFMGSESMAPLIRRLVPGVQFETRPRLSQLSYIGHRKLSSLPRRSAVVAFSSDDVYAIAELVRRQRGGAAVVMGALSPRTRNAQVAMYQSGEVDYLVATDAIGMGLNMDVNHVAFAALRKFDGFGERLLSASEIAQIAGRAGRHVNDGTFGTTADAPAMEEDVVNRVETHDFSALQKLYWRNTDLDFTSLSGLKRSLGRMPPRQELLLPRRSDDLQALETLSLDADVQRMARGPDLVSLLWTVCRVPDFRKLGPEHHTRLLEKLFTLLSGGTVLPDDWIEQQVARIDRTDGDIHTLVDRIAHGRIWTYIAHQTGWLDDPDHWQSRTRALEDRLSDALHDRLTQRFVDRRTATLMQRLGDGATLSADVDSNGSVAVEGHAVGRMDGLSFQPDTTGRKPGDKAVLNAARQALRGEFVRRADQLVGDPDTLFALSPDGQILWRAAVVADLRKGATPLRPTVALCQRDALDEVSEARVLERLRQWLDQHLAERLGPLTALSDGAETGGLSGPVRGVLFQLQEAFGCLRADVLTQMNVTLTVEEKAVFAKLGVRLGREWLYMPALLKPAVQADVAVLWSLAMETPLADRPALPPAGRVSAPVQPTDPTAFWQALGFMVAGGTAFRVDMVERFAAEVRRAARRVKTPDTPLNPDLLSLLGVGAEQGAAVLRALGWIVSIAPPETAETQETPVAQPGADGTETGATETAVAAPVRKKPDPIRYVYRSARSPATNKRRKRRPPPKGTPTQGPDQAPSKAASLPGGEKTTGMAVTQVAATGQSEATETPPRRKSKKPKPPDRGPRRGKKRDTAPPIDPDHPFAALRQWSQR